MGTLVLLRHGISEWNDLGLWTGWKDIPLNEKGEAQAKEMATFLKDINFDAIFTSKLVRAQKTCDIVKKELGIDKPSVECTELNERNYGIFTGKNKWEIRDQVGEEEFQKIRRGWDHRIPEGESLKQVYDRVIPYFEEQILPLLKSGKNVLMVAHGNSLRALTKYLCDLSEEEVCNLEFGMGEVHVYKIDEDGKVISKEIRNENPNKGKI